MKINNVEVCKPVETLVKHLLDENFSIIERKISDYHFHELYIKMSGRLNSLNSDIIETEGINKISNTEYYCSCHWSTVEICEGGNVSD
jgi:hypothetical protein